MKNNSSNYLPILSIIFYMILLSSALAGQKLILVFGMVISAGNLIFQLSYMLIACITELYKIKSAKSIILTGAACNIFVSFYFYLILKIPSPDYYINNAEFSKIMLITSNILFNSTLAYVISEFSNVFIISNLRILFKNKYFFFRAVISVTLASIIDTIFMLPIILSRTPENAFKIFYSIIFSKLLFSIILMPVLYILVIYLKRTDPALKENTNNIFSSVSYLNNFKKLSTND